MESPSIEARWFKCLETLDLEQIDEFKMKFKNTSNPREMVRNVKKIDLKKRRKTISIFILKLELGLVKAADMGSNKLIDYFLNLKVDVNCLCTYNVISFQISYLNIYYIIELIKI